MAIPLLFSIIIAIIGFLYLVNAYVKEEIFYAEIGLLIIVFVAVLGFGMACDLIPIKTLQVVYYEPDSKFQDDKYCVLVLNGQTFCTGEARLLTKAKDGICKIGKIEKLNSYGSVCVTNYDFYIFTKDELAALDLQPVCLPAQVIQARARNE